MNTISTRCKDATLISAESSWIDPHRTGTERHNISKIAESGYFEIVTFDNIAYVVDINWDKLIYFIYCPLFCRPFYWAIQSVVSTARKLVLQMVQLEIDNIYKLALANILVKRFAQ
jgi:hypothetical protein